MRKFILILLLSGCTPLLFDKPGVPAGGGQKDLTDCEVEALAKVPQNSQTRTIYGGPATTYASCTGNYCTANTYGGQDTTYSVDTNSNLRQRVLIQCMADKGYTLRQ